MYKSRTKLFTLLLATSAFAIACPTPRGGGGTGADDDDDAAPDDDDDDDAAPDDDDDDATDDDDFTQDDDDFTQDDDDAAGAFDADGISFQLELEATEGATGNVVITGSYTFTYWVDIQNGIEQCQQVINFEAQYFDGFSGLAGCTNCSGYMSFNLGAFQDVSNPNLDPDQCLPADLDAAGANYGVRMTQPADATATPPNYGDFGTDLGIIDQATHAVLGTDWTVDATIDRTRDGAEAEWGQYSLDYTHAGFVNATPTSLAGGAGLSAITRPEDTGSAYLASWEFFTNPTLNMNPDNVSFEGPYGGSAMFILTLGAE